MPPTIIRFRKSVTQWSICARFCTCAPARTLSRLFSVFAALLHRQSIAFSMNAGSFTYTPIFTGSDCEGAGEMFRVTTLDMDNPPRTGDGKVDFSKTFSENPATLPSAASFTARHLHLRSAIFHVRTHIPCRKQQHRTSCRGVLADRARNGFLRPQRLHGYRRGDD